MEFAPLDIALRLGAAAAAGMVLGINRDMHNKPLGMRTLGLVALGAAIASVSALEYGTLSDHPDALSRVVQGIIQGIMAGISFIGAGVILRDTKRRTVEGLTTAATVWVAAALGIACGLAMWWTVAISVGMALLLLVAIGWVEDIFGTREGNRD